MKRRCLLIFLKSPDAKKIKSRLAKSIGEKHARSLYKCFVSDLLDAMDTGTYRLVICFHPPGGGQHVKKWLGKGCSYVKQKGKHLGERMQKALEECFADGFEQVILIGSDIPDLHAGIVDQAFDSLDHSDAVIGPAVDGGYYLIGFNSGAFMAEAFRNIPWGTDIVFKRTCEILADKDLRFQILPPWRDIDTIEDLQSFVRQHRDTPFAESKTMQYAMSLNLLDPKIPVINE
jgi:uncharacterized protein